MSVTVEEASASLVAALGDRIVGFTLRRHAAAGPSRLSAGLAAGLLVAFALCPAEVSVYLTKLLRLLASSLVHLNHRDVTLICFSRAPIERLAPYKRRMGWQFPYVSTHDTDFPFDFGLAMTEEQAQQIPEVKEKRVTGELEQLTATALAEARA